MAFEAVGGKCVFSSDSDRFARLTYEANFGDEPRGDITLIASDNIPDHDVLLAGFPCQPFSAAGIPKLQHLGRPHGFENKTQGTLFFEVARILRDKQPQMLLLENVKNLRSHDKGRTLKVILETLEELGYSVEYRVLSSEPLVPQKRERLFIVGWRGDCQINVLHPCADADPYLVGDYPKLRTILHPEDGSEPVEEPYTVDPYSLVNPKYTISPRLWENFQRIVAESSRGESSYMFSYRVNDGADVTRTLKAQYRSGACHDILIDQSTPHPKVQEELSAAIVNPKYTLSDHLWTYLQQHAAKHQAKGKTITFGLVNQSDVSRTLSARYGKDGSEILVAQDYALNPRKLTPRECARLMGFPDSFKIPVSDTQEWKQFGNSVVVPLVTRIAMEMKTYLEESCDESNQSSSETSVIQIQEQEEEFAA